MQYTSIHNKQHDIHAHCTYTGTSQRWEGVWVRFHSLSYEKGQDL